MRAKRAWTYQSLFTCFFWNGILLAVLFYAASRILDGVHQWMSPFLQPTNPPLPENAHQAFIQISSLIVEARRYLAPAIFGFGGFTTCILWLLIVLEGRHLATHAQAEVETAAPSTLDKRARKKPKEKDRPEATHVQPSPQPAVQMLTILQRQGRLIDFLQEDLSLYEDAQIGAAVRSIHQGCKESLSEYVDLKPIFEENEGVEIMVQPNFDSSSIRLTGNVTGDPPFKGILRHRGWRAVRVDLPSPASAEQKKEWVVAPAEVEVE